MSPPVTPVPGPANPTADRSAPAGGRATPAPAGRAGAGGPEPGGGTGARRAGRLCRLDAGIILVYLAAAVVVLYRLWMAPGSVNPAANSSDPPFFEWALIHATRIVTHGENPFAAPGLNAPLGVNLMANTGLLGMTVPLVPVTLLFGPSVAFLLMITLGLAGTASAWYLVLSRPIWPAGGGSGARPLVQHRCAAAVGGAFAGFGPGMINHANAHPNLVAQFLLPVILWRALTMRTVRHGLVLGLLVTWQAFLNEELLFLAALAGGLLVLGYGLYRPAEVRAAAPGFLRGAGAAAAVAGPLLAFPLWYQFFGPQHYRGLPGFVLTYGADLASYPAFAKLSLIGQAPADAFLAPQPEENTFLGWPLLLALPVIVGWRYRRVAVRALALVGLVFFVLSPGVSVTYRGRLVLARGPWSFLAHLPLFDSVVPARLGLVLIPVVALLLAIAVDALLDRGRAGLLGIAVLAVALVPVVPRPLPVAPRPVVPAFIRTGDWRHYLAPGHSLLSADTTWDGNIAAMGWANAADQGYPMVGGYFLGPDGSGRGSFGPQVRPTAALLADIGYRGGIRRIGTEQRAEFARDLAYWRCGLVVLSPDAPHAADLHAALDQLAGTGRPVDDVWVWDVSGLPG